MSKQRSNSPPTDSDPSRKSATQPRHQAANRPSPEPEAPRVTAPIHPYPPHQYIMNHPGGYPINGSPFTQQYPPPPPPPGTPGGPQYAYPIHSPYPPPHHYYHPQYPPQVMMYGPPPGHHQQPNTPGSAGSPVQETGTKRKRKSTSAAGRGKDKSDDEGDSSGLGAHQNQKAALDKALELKKRTKTQRACDSCRSRKIRCDILTETEPPKCQHCKQYAFDCTFFLPITETRFKKKKLDEEGADKEGKSPIAEKRDISVLGPTSTAHLLHSQASISSRIYEGYDSRYHHSFEVSKNGDGLIRVERPAQSEQQMTLPKPVDLHIEPQIVEQLLNAYFSEVAPILPIITQADFLATPAPAPILLYSMCLVAAARREVPQAVFDSIRYAVNGVIKAEDVLSTPTMANVQALLILCMTGDCHSQFVPTALSAMWARLGTAIRMAQDLGLHRAELVKHDIELRRRVWGACLISDRWTSLVYGFPYMIDVHDCDVRLPSSGDSKDMYMDELVRLSVIGGRVVKTIYSPSGLTLISDEILYKLLADIESWKANLPENLRFRGADSPQSAGILHLLYTSVCMIFWRVFMRISYSCPEHLKFGLTVEQWSLLVTMTGDSIDWLDANEKVYDVWLLFAYAATSCAFVQYHTWVRRQDTDAVQKLRKLRDCVRRWEGSISPDHMSARRKTAEIITLLYEATQGPQLPLETPALNPTAGAKGKQPQALDYKPDPSRPGAGVFIAHKDSPNDFEDLPAGVVIKDGEQEPDTKGEAAHRERSRVLASSSSAFAPPLPDAGVPSSSAPRRLIRSGNNASAQPGVADAGAAATAGASSMVNLTPLRGSHSNVNPAMNAPANPGQVQVMNVLDVPQASNTLREFAMADTGFLEGIPGGMFDWGQWDTFFSRINPAAPGETNGGVPSVYQEQEGRQQRQE